MPEQKQELGKFEIRHNLFSNLRKNTRKTQKTRQKTAKFVTKFCFYEKMKEECF